MARYYGVFERLKHLGGEASPLDEKTVPVVSLATTPQPEWQRISRWTPASSMADN